MEEIRVLITTDNHLGFAERDHIRGEDSFRAFEEVFVHARRAQADCILICGDLFHEVSPSKYTIYRTMEILQRNVLGDKPIQIECIDNENFLDIHKATRQPNYYSQNVNIEMPVFAIHGNHDEPSGHKGVTALDIFAEAGLINYFGMLDGKTSSTKIRPVVLRKKGSLLNLYGMGGIRDEAMTKLLAEERVAFETTRKGTNVLIIHQTRCGVGNSSYVPEELLSKEMHLVVWGHMHQSQPHPVMNYKTGFHTIQPGSTVQTSLCKAESGYKHCVLLKVTEEGYSTEPIRMESTRSLIFRTISAQEDSIEEKIRGEMASLLEESEGEHRPLVRLRVEVDESVPNTVILKRIMEEFKDRVANPKEALRIVHRKQQKAGERREALTKTHKVPLFTVEMDGIRILSESVFMQSIMECIDKENKFTISQRYNEIVQEVVKVLNSHRWTDIEKEIDPAVREIEKRLTYAYRRGDRSQQAEITNGQDILNLNLPENEECNLLLSAEEHTKKEQEKRKEKEQDSSKERTDVLEYSPNQVAKEEKYEDKNPSKRQKTDYTFSSLWS